MTAIANTLVIIGAGEGSWYSAGGRVVDVRYKPTLLPNANSGLSFGTFQFDVATNIEGQTAFRAILQQGVAAKTIDVAASQRLYTGASSHNAEAHLTAADVATITHLLGSPAARLIIDAADRARAGGATSVIDGMIGRAAQVWSARRITAPILTPGGTGNLRLFAYILATWNRYERDRSVMQNWLDGMVVRTARGPAAGFHLTAPPTIEAMHTFLSSLRIWDGTQGNYQYLRDRLDPTLTRLGG